MCDLFHEIGAEAARTGQTLEVSKDDTFYGSRRGINMPFSYHGETAAVIGITGDPDEVRKYGYLARLSAACPVLRRAV
ncbi:sugar diacid recognition domain-containing protein [Clostridium vitabionis]|uniref:sugar diacid recognition domain-containing protein n=1 Tax=Clostridium vitabionis TaxID=2784388 RepID=UPI00188C5F8D|nr:sugar diacid recognition domain-containing protein [Clostridium vitabionis]